MLLTSFILGLMFGVVKEAYGLFRVMEGFMLEGLPLSASSMNIITLQWTVLPIFVC